MMARNIMIQGTMSSAGKSFMTAGLLRILKQEGFRVAPFKSQNMALNSFVTENGLEMGRAQVMQAEAAGIRPSVSMNPILLKPSSDMTSQVIVGGEVRGDMSAGEYFSRKKEFIPFIMEEYHKLEEEYDIIVLEGAGSPAEINLRQNDIVNMGMAELVNAPVLLVGDIDRGGVFAQLYGTVALLEEKEKKRIKGFLINKFRGDEKLLRPGINMLYKKCRIPVAGVIPYLHLDIDDEDCISERLQKIRKVSLVDIVVIHLPHIANFTDFNPLENVENISLRYVSAVQEIGKPDLIILPGTKNTMGDLFWLRQNGLEEEIRRLVGTEQSFLMGVCGGYQMMGESLSDPLHVEEGGVMDGLSFLPVRTVFGETKVRSRVEGAVCALEGVFQPLSGSSFCGYEIHMGQTAYSEEVQHLNDIRYLDGSSRHGEGCVYKNCIGTYVHGIFEDGSFMTELLRLLFDRKGLIYKPSRLMDYQTYKNKQYDMLADGIREHLDMKLIYHILGLS